MYHTSYLLDIIQQYYGVMNINAIDLVSSNKDKHIKIKNKYTIIPNKTNMTVINGIEIDFISYKENEMKTKINLQDKDKSE